MTLLQQIRDRVIVLLNDFGSEQGIPEFTKRRWSTEEQLADGALRGAVLFYRETPQRPDMRFPVTTRSHFLAVQVVTATEQPEQIDDALEVARDWMIRQLGNTTLEGLVHDAEEGETVWETASEKMQRMHGAFTTLWRFRYQTNRSNLQLPS